MARPLWTLSLALPLLTGTALGHDGHHEALVGAAGHAEAAAPLVPEARPEGPVLIPHLVDEVRELVPVAGQLFVHNPGAQADAPLELVELRVLLEGVVVEARPLERELHGDPRFTALLETLEVLPHEVTEMHRERFLVPDDAPEVAEADLPGVVQRMTRDLNVLRTEWRAGSPEPFVALDLTLFLDQLFEADAPVGAVRRVDLQVDWRPSDGAVATTSVSVPVTRLAPRPAVPLSLARRTDAEGQPLAASAPHVHAGDLHVHSCHGEAAGACAPSGNCGAETLQLTGSFSYAQLRTQYQALGMDWFTATDHSYCIDSSGEYAVVVAECAALTDAGFLVIPDTELSSDEQGPQQGSDLGDAICLGGTSSNHMGAHGISAWKQGGQEAFWGFCDGPFTDELDNFTNNINKIRAEGGYPIANHPAGSSFGWNSVSGLFGIENDDVHGIEVWNGASASGQGDNVGMWVDWLEDGRILYAYSGSDTHDEAFAFGANHVLLEASEAFTIGSVERALREGRSYISNGPVLVHEAEVLGDRIGMGSLQTLSPVQVGKPVTVEAHYDLGAGSGTVTLFGGVEGASEVVLATSAGLTGQGVLTATFFPAPGKHSWTRAYAQSSSGNAYTNPVFYLTGTASSTPYGGGLGGANVGTLASASAPAIGSTVELDLSGLAGASSAILAMSSSDLPGGLPFAGGFLLISLPTSFQTSVPLDGAGAGSFSFRMPWAPGLVGGTLYWQSVAGTPLQTGGLAFTNGLAMPIAGLGQ